MAVRHAVVGREGVDWRDPQFLKKSGVDLGRTPSSVVVSGVAVSPRRVRWRAG